MPTPNPRLTITLTPAVAATLRELSALTGNSQSAMVGELLEEGLPVFTRMIRVLRAAKEVKSAVRSELVASLDAAQSRLEGQLGLALDDMDRVEGQLLEEVEEVKRRGGRDAPADRPPGRSTPISNRGVRSTQIGKKATKAGVRRGPV